MASLCKQKGDLLPLEPSAPIRQGHSQLLLPSGILPKLKQVQNKRDMGGDSGYQGSGKITAMFQHGLL